MSKLAILIVGYNRPKNVERLLKSLDHVDYNGDHVDLLISIDNSGEDSVEKAARMYTWKFGDKKIYTYSRRMGLKNHIIHCGRFLQEYDAIAVLEDDLYVSPAFYNYMKQAVEKYKDSAQVAGISLYTHLWNPNPEVNLPFEPAESEYDAFFIQYAQSWGQIWMKKQWDDFMSWYESNSDEINITDNFPDYIIHWEKSWLKYHIKYCVEKNKYFVYPYKSFTTCFTDIGEHNYFGGNIYQVPLSKNCKKQYEFPELNSDSAVFYDVFFERIGLGKYMDIKDDELIIDLYGAKKVYNKKYLLSCHKIPYSVVREYGLAMRPHEENIVHQIAGNKLFLYKLEDIAYQNKKNRATVNAYIYYHRICGNTNVLLEVCKTKVTEFIRIKHSQLIKK